MILTYRSPGEEIESAVESVLQSWKGCPYVAGGTSKKHGADCVRTGTGVLSELFGRTIEAQRLPQDVGMHNPRLARQAMRDIRRRFMPNIVVQDGVVEAGDVLVTAWENGGPGHMMIVGQGKLYHTARQNSCFWFTGMVIPPNQRLVRIYRYLRREEWLK